MFLHCTDCGDGTLSCPVAQCVTGKCRTSVPGCHDFDPAPSSCIACGSTTCAGYRCIDSACVLSCPVSPDAECQVPEDCPGNTFCDKCPDDSCATTTCENGKCVRLCAS